MRTLWTLVMAAVVLVLELAGMGCPGQGACNSADDCLGGYACMGGQCAVSASPGAGASTSSSSGGASTSTHRGHPTLNCQFQTMMEHPGDGESAIALAAGGRSLAAPGATCVELANGGVGHGGACWGADHRGAASNTDPAFVPLVSTCLLRRKVTMGSRHSCAGGSGGSICWGDNSVGEIDPESSTSEIAINALAAAFFDDGAVAGDDQTCWLAGDVVEHCTGRPGPIVSLTTREALPEPLLKLALGRDHACAITASTGVRCWGDNGQGQCGNGSPGFLREPVELPALLGAHELALGAQHTCATLRGDVFCWGDNTFGQVGIEGLNGESAVSPGLVTGPGGERLAAFSLTAGPQHTCAISNNRLLCWGSNSHGQAGQPNVGGIVPRPTAVAGFPPSTFLRSVAAGSRHTCALVGKDGDANQVWCVGDNTDGQLGVDPEETPSSAVPVRSL